MSKPKNNDGAMVSNTEVYVEGLEREELALVVCALLDHLNLDVYKETRYWHGDVNQRVSFKMMPKGFPLPPDED